MAPTDACCRVAMVFDLALLMSPCHDPIFAAHVVAPDPLLDRRQINRVASKVRRISHHQKLSIARQVLTLYTLL